MKHFRLALIAFLVLIPTVAHAEFYKVTVKRVDSNLYKIVGSEFYIQTKYCYEYTYGDEAVLKYEQYAYDNKLIFSSGTSRDVDKIF